jgi:hypothetical protein
MPRWMALKQVIFSKSGSACLLDELAGCAKKRSIRIGVGFLENMSYSHCY